MSLLSCKLDPADPNARRLTLGDVHLLLVSTLGSGMDIEFSGRVVGVRDSLYEEPGVGSFKNFVDVQDTNTGHRLKVYYTLPISQYLKVDTTTRMILIYKRNGSRSALLIKDKNDSLLCLFGTLLLPDLEQLEVKGGVQTYASSPATSPPRPGTRPAGAKAIST